MSKIYIIGWVSCYLREEYQLLYKQSTLTPLSEYESKLSWMRWFIDIFMLCTYPWRGARNIVWWLQPFRHISLPHTSWPMMSSILETSPAMVLISLTWLQALITYNGYNGIYECFNIVYLFGDCFAKWLTREKVTSISRGSWYNDTTFPTVTDTNLFLILYSEKR